jgi:hypothetical protein
MNGLMLTPSLAAAFSILSFPFCGEMKRHKGKMSPGVSSSLAPQKQHTSAYEEDKEFRPGIIWNLSNAFTSIQIARSHPSIQGYGQSWANSWKPGSHACSRLRSRGGRPPLPVKRFIAISRCKEQVCAWGWKPVGKRAGWNDCPPSRGTRHSSGAAAHKRAGSSLVSFDHFFHASYSLMKDGQDYAH